MKSPKSLPLDGGGEEGVIAWLGAPLQVRRDAIRLCRPGAGPVNKLPLTRTRHNDSPSAEPATVLRPSLPHTTGGLVGPVGRRRMKRAPLGNERSHRPP